MDPLIQKCWRQLSRLFRQDKTIKPYICLLNNGIWCNTKNNNCLIFRVCEKVVCRGLQTSQSRYDKFCHFKYFFEMHCNELLFLSKKRIMQRQRKAVNRYSDFGGARGLKGGGMAIPLCQGTPLSAGQKRLFYCYWHWFQPHPNPTSPQP